MKSQAKRRWVVLGASIVGVGVLLTGVHAQSVLFVQSNRVGIGTNTPTASLNVYGTDSGSENRLLVQNSSGDTANRNMLELVNDNGGVQFFLTSESLGTKWQFSNTGAFIVSLTGTGGPEFTVRSNGRVKMGTGSNTTFDLNPSGNLAISGTLSEGSSRSIKRDFSAVDSLEVLNRVNELPLTSWNYKFDDPTIRHLGPVAEDFHAAFALGEDEKRLSSLDTSGVALAAIQGLSQLVDDKETAIAELQLVNAEMAERLDAIEKTLATLTQNQN